jgi:hypothetical protein
MEAQIDYFEQWKELPEEAQTVLEQLEGCDADVLTFTELDQINEQFKKLGFEFDYDLSGQVFNLFKIA